MRTLIRAFTIAGILGLSSVCMAQVSEQVNTTSTQTLTNKTLTAPTVTGPTVTGAVSGSGVYDTPTLTSPTVNGAILGSASWDSPGAIGAGTPATISGTTITATSCFVVVTQQICSSTGSPQSVITAPVGSLYVRQDGGAGTTLYVKESGVGNTGWVAYSSGAAVSWTAPGTIGSGTPNTGAFTTLSVTGQFSSSLSTGTAPLSIASTTKVSNLNVDMLDGGDWASPIAIGTTTPSAITGTTITATGCAVIIFQKICSGAGSPEGVITGPVGSLYQRNDGSTGTTLYTKESGSGNTGWATISGGGSVSLTAPGPIGSVTPNTGAFTDLTANRRISNGVIDAYGPTIAIDSSIEYHYINATNSTAFTISNPTNAVTGGILIIQIANTSGGILGSPLQFDTAYKMAAFTKPDTGFSRIVTFRYDGAHWIELNCSPPIPN